MTECISFGLFEAISYGEEGQVQPTKEASDLGHNSHIHEKKSMDVRYKGDII